MRGMRFGVFDDSLPGKINPRFVPPKSNSAESLSVYLEVRNETRIRHASSCFLSMQM